MSGDNPFVPREQSVRIGKFLLVLSFFLPYLVLIPSADSYSWIDWMIYAPIWVLQGQGEILAGGPHPFALLMFQFWLPYILIGYQAYRFAKGRLSGERNYFRNIVILTVVAILLALPLSLTPSGGSYDGVTYTPYIPIPIIPIIAILSYRLLRPNRIETPWSKESEKTKMGSKEESIWTD